MREVDMCNTDKSTEVNNHTHRQENLKHKTPQASKIPAHTQKVLTSLQCHLQNFSSVLRLLKDKSFHHKKEKHLPQCVAVFQGWPQAEWCLSSSHQRLPGAPQLSLHSQGIKSKVSQRECETEWKECESWSSVPSSEQQMLSRLQLLNKDRWAQNP